MSQENILAVNNLSTEFDIDTGTVRVLDNVGFNVPQGKTLGIVGESGCGKSVTAMSIMGLLPHPYGRVAGGEILYQGQDLTQLSTEDMFKIRGNSISMIFQEPMTALNPVHTIGRQLMESYRLHRPEFDAKAREQAAISMLKKVGIPSPEKRMENFPHQLSGGMRQRVMIAMALACEPDLLICDEPTTALDVTIQAQILELMQELQKDNGMSIIFITHDLGVVAEICDEVVVMYAGRVAEQAHAIDLFESPRHPYTQGLLKSIPRLEDTPKTILPVIEGFVPSLQQMPAGCRFQNRCPKADDQCTNVPALEMVEKAETNSDFPHKAACWYKQPEAIPSSNI